MISLSNLQAIVTLVLVIFGPTILPRVLGSFHSRPPTPPRPPTSRLAKLIIACHAFYRLYELVWPPFNVFTTHGLTIYASNNLLRARLLPSPSSSHLPALLGQSSSTNEILLTKLASLDNRLLYARFGHRPLSSCAWCHTKTDYLMSAMAGIALPYLLTAVLLGILGLAEISGLTAAPRKAAWRSTGSCILGIMAISDIGARYLWEIRVTEGDTLQLDALIHTLRSIAFLLVPVIYILLPLPTSLNLSALIPSLSNTTSTIRLTALARNAALNDAVLREALGRSMQEEQVLREVARKDPFVQSNAERLGLREGDIRVSARNWIEDGWNGLVRVGQPG